MAASVMPIVGSGVFELCIFNPRKSPEYVGYYDDVAKADKYIADHLQWDIYLTPQILNPSLTQRGHNTMVKANERTKDTEVLGYKYLLIELDPRQNIDGVAVKRPRGVSAVDEEHQAAIALARHIVSQIGLEDENYILVDSGNGCHLYIPVESGIQEPAIKAAMEGIKTLYETDMVEVDTTAANPGRLMRAPGSINNKGAIKRPCTYLHCPEHIMPVDYKFIAGLKVEDIHEVQQKGNDVDLAEKIANQLGYITKKPGPIYLLKECPFCKNADKGAVVGRRGEAGGYFFKCHHNSCKNKKWGDLKEHVGLAIGRLDRVKKVLKEQGASALETPEVQAEISKLKALGELHKLQDICKEVGIEYKALKAAARKPFAIAQDMADVWINQYHIKTDKLSRDLYYYQDGIYVDAEDFIGGLIDEKFRGLNTTTFINNTLEYIRRHSLYEFTDEWLAVDNGLINPATLELIGFSPDRVTRIKLNVAYDPAAKCPAWDKFQEECKADTTVLQETAGYSLLPGYPHEKAVMLVGNGGQGKSVWMIVISSILGMGNVSHVALQSLFDNRFASASMYRKLANFAGDIGDMALTESDMFKRTTGNDPIRAEEKGKPAFDFLSRAKQVYSANAIPPTKDKSTGYFRRWIIIEFLREMVQNPNIHLAAELLAEKPGIFNWMLEGAKRVNAQGFTYTKNPEEMAEKYTLLSEPVVAFLRDRCEEDYDEFVPSGELHREYTTWAKEHKKKPVSSKAFVNAMKNQTVYAIEYGRNQAREDRPRGYTGIKLNFTSDRPTDSTRQKRYCLVCKKAQPQDLFIHYNEGYICMKCHSES